MASAESAATTIDGLGDRWAALFSESPQGADFLCSLSSKPMVDPVQAEDGFNYEREAILEYFASAQARGDDVKSPMLFSPMGTTLEPATDLQAAIRQFAASHGERADEEQEETWELIQWQPHGMQPPGVNRSLSPGGQRAQLLHPSLRLSDMNKRMSDVFRVLDPMRDLLREVLDGWTPPKIVVIGDESSGKSTVLEQLAMMPVFPRHKRFCTRLPIQVRLRRNPAASIAKLSVMRRDNHSVEVGPRTIPIEQGFSHVQAEMDRLIAEHPSDSGLLKSKIVVLEVQHPSVPSIDLVDLPGLTAIKKGGRADEVEEIIEMQLEEDRVSGDQAMYLVIVPAASRPNCSLAMGFIERNKLQSRAFGVFSHCDERGKLATDELRSLMTGCITADGEVAEDLGYVPLEKGWVGTMLAKPKDKESNYAQGYYDCHNYERLYLQKRTELEFFSGEAADPVLKELYDEGRAGVPALAGKLVSGYMDCLNSTWKREAMMKVLQKLEEKEFERDMLGRINGNQTEKLAAEEAKRRLTCCPAFNQYLDDVVRTKLTERLSEVLSKGCCPVSRARLHDHCEGIKKSVDAAVREILLHGDNALVAFFAGQLKAALTAELKVEPQDPWEGGVNIQVVTRSFLGYVSEIMTPRRRRDMYKAVKEQPPFRLDQFTEYTDAILSACGEKLQESADHLERDMGELSTHLVSFASKWMSFSVPAGSYSVTVQCDVQGFVDSAIALCFARVPSPEWLLTKIKLEEIPVGVEARAALERRACLDEEIDKIKTALDGIRTALGVSDQELDELCADMESAPDGAQGPLPEDNGDSDDEMVFGNDDFPVISERDLGW